MNDYEPYKKPNKEITCHNCKFLVSRDVGYSDYTIVDTEITCIKNKFKFEDIEDRKLEDIAADCLSFKKGEPIYLSVERDYKPEDFQEDKEQYDALVEFGEYL